MGMTDYHYPDNPNITLVDCPGLGTENFPNVKTYGKKIKIDTYDAFIIITAVRFTIHAGRLARKVKSMNKPFFLVRTKIDQDHQNERRTKQAEFNEVEMLEKIKADCLSKLSEKEAKVEDNDVFLISNFYRYHWDFARLTKAINRGLPFRKSECFLLSMNVLSKDILERKVTALKGKIWWVALFYSCIGKVVRKTESSRRSDFKLIVECVELYRSQLGFPKEDSKEFKKMPPERQDAMKKFFLKPTNENVKSWLGRFDTERGVENNEEFPSWLSVDKAIEAPYKFVYRALHQVLDEMKEIALEIVKDATARAKAEINMGID
ncbi:interferon-inducible GTPase 1-like [Dendronephthya gigantea]|uniref:interferon-inducible GTPase 1-like n=1 Tax=Dendronephthya gigantea TaxID=151771 RepID=UPI0010699E4F|nr:interferon-inducible GTPase 1-like [Dendronephthya gigantea]